MQKKRTDESAKAFHAYCDYRDMGVGRSLRALVDRYVQQVSNKPPTKKWNTISTWSHKNEWQKRVDDWDNKMATVQTKTKEDAIKELIDNELNDYNDLLNMWKLEFRALPLHLRNHVTTKHNESTGQLTITEFEKLTYDAFHQMVKARDDIAKQGRRALGLPDKITEKNVEVKTWEDRAIEDIKSGEIGYTELAEEFDSDLATKLFRLAGVEVTEG